MQLLEDGLLDVYEEVEDCVSDPLFQQDNTWMHTARDTMEWFDEHNINVMMDFPPNSPDLNPIEHVWKKLKESLHRRFPSIHKTPEEPPAVRRVLAHALSECWEKDIKSEFLERLWESMPQRLAAVRRANGWYTKY